MPKPPEFNADIAIFFAGANPLYAEFSEIRNWLTTRAIAFKAIDALADPVLSPLLATEAAQSLLPVLYANGRMLGRNSLEPMLRNPEQLEIWLHAPPCRKIPQFWATSRSVEALRQTQVGAGHRLRLSISAEFEHELQVEEAREYDWVVDFGGVKLAVDPLSMARADGVTLDWLSQGEAHGFMFDNPNSASGLHRLASKALEEWLESPNPPLVIDVRTEAEFLDGRLPEARLLDPTLVEALSALDRNTALVFYCNNGVRSLSTARRYGDLGFFRVAALEGGLEAWKRHFEPQSP